MEFRFATPDDAAFVAQGVTMALHLDPEKQDMKLFTSICAREDVLYSWRHTLLAIQDGQPVGLCLAYDGKDYHSMKELTFRLFAEGRKSAHTIDNQENNSAENIPNPADDMDLEHMEDETCAGEYYIDSLSVLPQYRRQGIAKQLLRRQMQEAKQFGLVKITLLVDPANPQAQDLYKQCGFVFMNEIYAFGQIFWKMEAKSVDL